MADAEKVLLTIRLPRSLRDQFQQALQAQDQQASQVLRAAIRAYLKQHGVPEPESKPVPSPPSELPSPNPEIVASPPPPSTERPFAGVRAMLECDDDE